MRIGVGGLLICPERTTKTAAVTMKLVQGKVEKVHHPPTAGGREAEGRPRGRRDYGANGPRPAPAPADTLAGTDSAASGVYG